MTLRTITRLLCSCGHQGEIVVRENDQPYSSPWSTTSLEGLEAKGHYTGSNDLFREVQPSCPKCGSPLSPENVIE
jgi:hypothetical protein